MVVEGRGRSDERVCTIRKVDPSRKSASERVAEMDRANETRRESGTFHRNSRRYKQVLTLMTTYPSKITAPRFMCMRTMMYNTIQCSNLFVSNRLSLNETSWWENMLYLQIGNVLLRGEDIHCHPLGWRKRLIYGNMKHIIYTIQSFQ